MDLLQGIHCELAAADGLRELEPGERVALFDTGRLATVVSLTPGGARVARDGDPLGAVYPIRRAACCPALPLLMRRT